MRVLMTMVMIAAASLPGREARAEDYPSRRLALEQAERTVAGKALSLWTRLPGPRRAAVQEQALAQFGKGRAAAWRGSGEDAVVRGDGWFVHVGGEGDSIQYREESLIDKARPISPEERPGLAQIEAQARRIVDAELSPYLALGKGEGLTAWYAGYQGAARGGPDGKTIKDVRALHVVFARTLDGLPVIGSGSKLRVLMTTDGALAGFDLDWPRLRRSKATQRVLAKGAIGRRREVAAAGRTSLASSATVESASLECGYHDVGVPARSQAPLQPACAASRHLVFPGPVPKHAGYVEIFPVGVAHRADPAWPESQLDFTR